MQKFIINEKQIAELVSTAEKLYHHPNKSYFLQIVKTLNSQLEPLE